MCNVFREVFEYKAANFFDCEKTFVSCVCSCGGFYCFITTTQEQQYCISKHRNSCPFLCQMDVLN